MQCIMMHDEMKMQPHITVASISQLMHFQLCLICILSHKKAMQLSKEKNEKQYNYPIMYEHHGNEHVNNLSVNAISL